MRRGSSRYVRRVEHDRHRAAADTADPDRHDGVPDVAVVVDVANVMGSRPDGWWRDRRAAATQLLTAFDALIGTEPVGPDGRHRRITRVVAVLEGAARGATSPGADLAGRLPVQVVSAPHDGDSAIVAQAEALTHGSMAAAGGAAVLVVTADRGLRARLPHAAIVAGPDWLNRLIGR